MHSSYIHTVIFEGLPCSGKSSLHKLFRERTGDHYLSYENGLMEYLAKVKEREIEAPLPANVFLKDLRHTLTVYLQVRPMEVVKRVVAQDKCRFDATHRYLLYNRIAEVYRQRPDTPFLMVSNNDYRDRAKAIESILKVLKPRGGCGTN